ncbi:MAG: N-acetylmuramoyl-L-alanine amidase [Clostridia bacterium]|nr:N-acetylmuramoyl-L-alanine amidase [Clostridia bacterium]
MNRWLRAVLALGIALALLIPARMAPALAELGERAAQEAAPSEAAEARTEASAQADDAAEAAAPPADTMDAAEGVDAADMATPAPAETPAGAETQAEESIQPDGTVEEAGDPGAAEEAEATEDPGAAEEAEEVRLPLAGVKIGIDPGHQAHGNSEKEAVAPGSKEKKAKVSSGTAGVSTRIPEYVTVLEISLKLREALQAQGAEVYMTRETHDVNLSNQERAKMMNELGVDLVLRIHCDGAEKRSRNGIALYCSHSNSIADESYRAAEAILPRVCEATGAKENGIVSNDNYTGQNWSEVPCLMVECGFLSNPDEDVKLNDEDYQWKLAAGLTYGIMDYIAARDAQEYPCVAMLFFHAGPSRN